MVDIIHRIGIKAPISKVRAAVATTSGVAGWWTLETKGESKEGGRFTVRFASPNGDELGKMTFELTRIADASVRWRCVDGPPEWLGTDVTFDLTEKDGMTVVLFGHRGWREAIEFTAHCSMKWATFLLSLRQLVETGEGKPSPVDLKIDDWN